MKTTFSIKTPDQIEGTVTVTATVDEFRRIASMLQDSQHRFNWPLAGFYKGVQQVISDAEKHFTSETKEIN